MENDKIWITNLSRKFYEWVSKELTHIQLNGDIKERYFGNLNISFSCVEGESLIMAIKEMAVSSGSACTSASLEPSYVLWALGVSEDMAHTSIRFGFGRFTTEEEINYSADLVVDQVKWLWEMSPLWEMVQDGIDLSTIKWTSGEH